jgi:hypothetical protein
MLHWASGNFNRFTFTLFIYDLQPSLRWTGTCGKTADRIPSDTASSKQSNQLAPILVCTGKRIHFGKPITALTTCSTLVSCLAHSLVLMVEAVYSPEMLVDSQRTIQSYNPEIRILPSMCLVECENLKTYMCEHFYRNEILCKEVNCSDLLAFIMRLINVFVTL